MNCHVFCITNRLFTHIRKTNTAIVNKISVSRDFNIRDSHHMDFRTIYPSVLRVIVIVISRMNPDSPRDETTTVPRRRRQVVLVRTTKCHVHVSVNSVFPEICGYNLELLNFKLILMTDTMSISRDIARRRMPQDLTNGYSMLAQVLAWCRQATSHYLNQCWSIFMSSRAEFRAGWFADLPFFAHGTAAVLS